MEINELEDKLNGFIEKVKNNKSFKSNSKIREEFSKIWNEYAAKTSLSNKAIEYYYDGFKIAWSDPFYEYLKKSQINGEKLKQFLIYRFDSYHPQYQLCLHLLSHLINDKNENQEYYEKLFVFMPHNFKNKEGKVNGNAEKDFEKYFLSRINKQPVLPDLKKMNLNYMQLSKLGFMFSYCLENLSEEAKSKYDKENADKILTWAKEINTDVEEKTKIPVEEKTNETIEDKLEKENNLIEKQKKDLENLNQYIADYKEIKTKQDSEISKLNISLRKRENDNFNLLREKHTLEEKVAELEKQITELKQNNTDSLKLLKNVGTDNQNKIDAVFDKLGDDLNVEYMDFQDAQNLEMSVALGENLKIQMENIFSILKKYGIKYE